MRTQTLTAAAISFACGLAITPRASAQSAPGTPANPADDELIVLSPFEVSTKKDVGYLAGNTLAGSRLNTSLMDTGAAISVLTPEFLKDIGATNMRDVILFQNNAVPDVGDAAGNVNGNPLIGSDEWQLRIRGLPASYARNFFKWDTSTDFYNVERIDQARGPNSILFGFGAGGGIVNTSTKQAKLFPSQNEVAFTVGSWDRYRGSVDFNQVLAPGKFALRVNAVAEDGKSWREFEFDKARRGHVALKYQPTKTSTIRAEAEIGNVKDNVARPWLATDQSFLWRNAGRPLFSGTWSNDSTTATFWPDHLVVADDGVVRNWLGRTYGSNANGASEATGWNAPTWSAIAETPANFAIIPRNSNVGGPDAIRETDYNSFSAFYENQVSEQFSFELALNHQDTDFVGYDADGGRATNYYGNSGEVFGDASSDLPDASGGYAGANPNAGLLYLENNWTRRTQNIKGTQVRATAAYSFKTGTWAKHRAAALYEYSVRDFSRREEAEVFLNMPLDSTKAEADVNRVYRRHYFQPGDSQDIHVASWRTPIANAGWVPNQPLENTTSKQNTGMVALQSDFIADKLVTILGYRYDTMDYTYDRGLQPQGGTRDAVTKQYRLDPGSERGATFDAGTLTAGAVYHLTKAVTLYGNTASSRDVPDVRIHVIGSELPPMPESRGVDFGVKFNLFDGKLYATAGYYTTKIEKMTDWGDVQTAVTDRNTKILGALQSAGLITAGEQQAHLVNANGYMQDRDAKGWEFQLIANPTPNWRISANFAINDVVGKNSMAEVKMWADENQAFWLSKAASQGGGDFLVGAPGDAWDTLGANIGWMNDSIMTVTGLDGKEVRGQRKYGGNLYTKYTFSGGPLKGFSIGGGGRYQSANVLGYYYNAVRKGTDLVLADASLGYGMKADFITKGAWLDFQVNVSNLLDTDKSQIYTLAWWDPNAKTPGNIGLQEPRKVSFTATLKF
jgi:outer membrane receptor protein involved in Fe transport